jgi:hypothetical protein
MCVDGDGSQLGSINMFETRDCHEIDFGANPLPAGTLVGAVLPASRAGDFLTALFSYRADELVRFGEIIMIGQFPFTLIKQLFAG